MIKVYGAVRVVADSTETAVNRVDTLGVAIAQIQETINNDDLKNILTALSDQDVPELIRKIERINLTKIPAQADVSDPTDDILEDPDLTTGSGGEGVHSDVGDGGEDKTADDEREMDTGDHDQPEALSRLLQDQVTSERKWQPHILGCHECLIASRNFSKSIQTIKTLR